jgi:hypothetical protein
MGKHRLHLVLVLEITLVAMLVVTVLEASPLVPIVVTVLKLANKLEERFLQLLVLNPAKEH